jgi:hypothetical protein
MFEIILWFAILTHSSKRSGLEKAIFQVEEAIKKRRSDATSDQNTLQHLRQLLSEASQGDELAPGPTEISPSPAVEEPQVPTKEVTGTSSDDQLAIEGVENPLQLLARASDLRIAAPHSYDHSATPDVKLDGSVESAYLDVHHFFLPMKASLDQGPGLDPIDVGLVTMEEAEMLLQ